MLSEHPVPAALSLVMTFTTGMLGGCGILLLIPLLQVIGAGQRESSHGVSRILTSLCFSVGLEPRLGTILLVFLILVGLQALLVRQSVLVNTQLQLGLGKQLQDRLFESIARCRWNFFTGVRQSDFVHALTHDLNRVSFGATTLLNLVSSGVLVAVHLTVSVLISPWLTVTVLCALGLLTPLLLLLNRLARKSGKQLSGKSMEYYHHVQQQLAGMKEFKSLGAEQRQIDHFQSLTTDMQRTQTEFRAANADSAVVFTFGSALLLSGIVLAAVDLFQTPVVELLVLVAVFSRIAPQFRQLQSQWQQWLHTLPAFESVSAMLERCDAEREQTGGKTPAATSVCPSKAAASCPNIELRNVSFRYGPLGTKQALKNLHVTIPAGRITALAGASGAGKTTVADLLLGLLVPNEGQILADGVPLSESSLPTWRSRIGYVPQETYLLNDTIRANLLLARPEATDRQLNEALQAAAGEFAFQSSRGLDSLVGDSGLQLSVGERQRLALARALLRQPDILILDEATSSLDTANQSRIQTAIELLRGRMTVVVIAHRLSTIRHADQIVVLDGGEIVEAGTFDSLTAQSDGIFRTFVDADRFRVHGSPPHQFPTTETLRTPAA
ncbi:MAG: ABC transporter ATP-binding protein [Planctomycetaceae bacterium]|nr:ABC transporter ATP-binding protein [Planctomycetaceae bacterium]